MLVEIVVLLQFFQLHTSKAISHCCGHRATQNNYINDVRKFVLLKSKSVCNYSPELSGDTSVLENAEQTRAEI